MGKMFTRQSASAPRPHNLRTLLCWYKFYFNFITTLATCHFLRLFYGESIGFLFHNTFLSTHTWILSQCHYELFLHVDFPIHPFIILLTKAALIELSLLIGFIVYYSQKIMYYDAWLCEVLSEQLAFQKVDGNNGKKDLWCFGTVQLL